MGMRLLTKVGGKYIEGLTKLNFYYINNFNSSRIWLYKFNNSYNNLNKIFLDIINVGGNNALNVAIFYNFNIKDFLENTNNLNNRVKNVGEEFIEFKSSFVRIIKIENFKAIQSNKKLKLSIHIYIL